jgi:hypothetical protein
VHVRVWGARKKVLGCTREFGAHARVWGTREIWGVRTSLGWCARGGLGSRPWTVPIYKRAPTSAVLFFAFSLLVLYVHDLNHPLYKPGRQHDRCLPRRRQQTFGLFCPVLPCLRDQNVSNSQPPRSVPLQKLLPHIETLLQRALRLPIPRFASLEACT